MIELKPCPFCGSHIGKITYEENRIYQVVCRNCLTVFMYRSTSQFNAEQAWNRRVEG